MCCGLSFLYLWILIKNSLPQSYSPLVTIPLSIGYLIAKNETEGKLETTWLTALNESLSSPSSCSVNDLFINLLQPLSLWTIACINIGNNSSSFINYLIVFGYFFFVYPSITSLSLQTNTTLLLVRSTTIIYLPRKR